MNTSFRGEEAGRPLSPKLGTGATAAALGQAEGQGHGASRPTHLGGAARAATDRGLTHVFRRHPLANTGPGQVHQTRDTTSLHRTCLAVCP